MYFASSQRKILDDILAFFGGQAMHGQENLVDGLANRHVITDQKDPRQGLTGGDAGISETWNRSTVVGQKNSALRGGPFQKGGIGRCR